MSTTDTLPAKNGRQSTAKVHEVLRRRILHGEIPPGFSLSQVQIAKEFNLSRGPVREALRLLQAEGLIEGEINHRSRVSSFSVPDLEGLYALRITVETFAIRVSVPMMTAEDLASLDRSLENMRKYESSDFEAWEKVHSEFHANLVKYAGRRTVELLSDLSAHAARYRRLDTMQQPRVWTVGREEHQDIVEACKKRQGNQAAKLLAMHLARTALSVLALKAPEHDAFQLRLSLQSATQGQE